MRLLGSAKKKDKDGEDVPKLESVEDVLVHCNLVNNSYQKYCLLLYLINNSVGFWQNFSLFSESAEATGDLIGTKIADQIPSLSKAKTKENEKEDEGEEIYIPPEKREQNIDDLRLF